MFALVPSKLLTSSVTQQLRKCFIQFSLRLTASSNVVVTRTQGSPKNKFIYTETCSESLIDQNLDALLNCEDTLNSKLNNLKCVTFKVLL